VRADAAIVVEPTDLRVAIAHRGFVGFEFDAEDVAAHGSRPDLGVDAIAKMAHPWSHSPTSQRVAYWAHPRTPWRLVGPPGVVGDLSRIRLHSRTREAADQPRLVLRCGSRLDES
jgi:hypothetical protein